MPLLTTVLLTVINKHLLDGTLTCCGEVKKKKKRFKDSYLFDLTGLLKLILLKVGWPEASDGQYCG